MRFVDLEKTHDDVCCISGSVMLQQTLLLCLKSWSVFYSWAPDTWNKAEEKQLFLCETLLCADYFSAWWKIFNTPKQMSRMETEGEAAASCLSGESFINVPPLENHYQSGTQKQLVGCFHKNLTHHMLWNINMSQWWWKTPLHLWLSHPQTASGKEKERK